MKYLKKAAIILLALCMLSISSCAYSEQPVSNVPVAYTDISDTPAETVEKPEETEPVQQNIDASVVTEPEEKKAPDIYSGVSTAHVLAGGGEIPSAAVDETKSSSGYLPGEEPDFDSLPAEDGEDVGETDAEPEDESSELDFVNLEEAVGSDSIEEDSVKREAEIEGFEYFVKVYRTDLKRYYNVPLSYELQEYTYKMSVKYNVPYRIVIGLFGVETSWNADIGVVNGYVGLGMLSEKYSADYFSEKGIDIYTPKGNIEATCYVLATKLDAFEGNVSYALMAYNLGSGGARTKIKKGYNSTEYSRRIIDLAYNLMTSEQYNEIKNG